MVPAAEPALWGPRVLGHCAPPPALGPRLPRPADVSAPAPGETNERTAPGTSGIPVSQASARAAPRGPAWGASPGRAGYQAGHVPSAIPVVRPGPSPQASFCGLSTRTPFSPDPAAVQRLLVGLAHPGCFWSALGHSHCAEHPPHTSYLPPKSPVRGLERGRDSEAHSLFPAGHQGQQKPPSPGHRDVRAERLALTVAGVPHSPRGRSGSCLWACGELAASAGEA